jgi:hypothetical protein
VICITARPHKVKGVLQSVHISEFETIKREPSLLLLLAYAKLAGISTDVLIDDKMGLPEQLPEKNKVIFRTK